MGVNLILAGAGQAAKDSLTRVQRKKGHLESIPFYCRVLLLASGHSTWLDRNACPQLCSARERMRHCNVRHAISSVPQHSSFPEVQMQLLRPCDARRCSSQRAGLVIDACLGQRTSITFTSAATFQPHRL